MALIELAFKKMCLASHKELVHHIRVNKRRNVEDRVALFEPWTGDRRPHLFAPQPILSDLNRRLDGFAQDRVEAERIAEEQRREAERVW